MKVLALIGIVAVGCVSCRTGDGNSDRVTLFGTFSLNATPVKSGGAPLEGARICALDRCSETDSSGYWTFSVSAPAYKGGDISFRVTAHGRDSRLFVSSFSPDAVAVQVDFISKADSNVDIGAIVESIPDQGV